MVLCIVKSSKLKPIVFCSLLGVLAGCSQTPQPVVSTPATEQKIEPEVVTGISAQQRLQQARQAQGEAQQVQLLRAARQALQEGEYPLALAITENLQHSSYPLIVKRNLPLLLQAYISNGELSRAEQLLQHTALSALEQTDRADFIWLGGQFYSSQRRDLAASRLLLQLDVMPARSRYPELWPLLWQHLTALNQQQLQSLRQGNQPRTDAWLALVELSRSYIGQYQQLQAALEQWQLQHPFMPTLAELPPALQQLSLLQPYQPRKIAVLLPLHGQFRQHARALQYGILAAASQQPGAGLIFLDSELAPEQIQQQLISEQVDFVIGPLLREQVDQISALPDWQWPTLFLNSRPQLLNSRGQQQAALAQRFYFALSMEDEASQMAQLFARKDYKNPVVISARNPISLRMQQHFAQQWQQLGHQAPEQYQFAAREELEAIITQLLETDASRERIRALSGLITEKLETDPHSRLDIDAIYLLADVTQTRLFKPTIDASVSQTAPRLPVYASSRSFSTNLDSNDQRDLNGLTFTETPWLVGSAHSQPLREQHQQWLGDQDEALQRLFAMGFDAYQLIGSLKQQQKLTSLSFDGLTGRLSLSAQGSIIRQLSWATYRNNRLLAIEEP
ncbi:penicillin-binding protein activator [Arsukibacterium sp.]|uniref:penicillin-binding protein activator n=1 Tax=Arsukibacterium sp. TaxID=1977258 RepID=UPI002FDAF137